MTVEKAGLADIGVVAVAANGVTGFEDEEDNVLDRLSTWGIYYVGCIGGLLDAGWFLFVAPLVMDFIGLSWDCFCCCYCNCYCCTIFVVFNGCYC